MSHYLLGARISARDLVADVFLCDSRSVLEPTGKSNLILFSRQEQTAQPSAFFHRRPCFVKFNNMTTSLQPPSSDRLYSSSSSSSSTDTPAASMIANMIALVWFAGCN